MDILDVLVVDDDPAARQEAASLLREFSLCVGDVSNEVGFRVNEAASAEEALALLETQTPNLLLVDLNMSGMTGIELLEKLAPRQLDMLAILTTSHPSIQCAVKAIKCGADDFVTKPYVPAELRNVVAKAAEQYIVAREARRVIREQHQMRFQFISVLAHELRAPLDAIEGYLHIVLDRSLGDDPGAYALMLDRCVTRVQFMRKMVVDLLDMARIETGRRKRELAEVDVREVAEAAIETALPDAREAEITFKLETDGPLVMYADRSELEIIFNNLISNAVKYNRRGGRVTVSLRGDEEDLTIAVSDTGIGLTKEEASRLFTDFVRIRNEKTHGILGSGLGLSIVKKLAALYGGSASVQSVPDQGSTFTVTLKRYFVDVRAVAGERSEPAPTP